MLKTTHSFVRRNRRMTKSKQDAFALLTKFGLEVNAGEINFVNIFGRFAPVNLEIGFGIGESLIAMALNNPNEDYIGIEVYRSGISFLLAQIAAYNLTNIRIYYADAIEVLRFCIPNKSLDKIMIFFPDPWPKRRHHKRRIIQKDFITLIHSKLKSNGYLHIATDWEDYALHVLRVMSSALNFYNVAGNNNFSPRPSYRPITKFERRGEKLGHKIWELIYSCA